MVVALLCNIQYTQRHMQPIRRIEQVLFHISGFATMTLLINGTFAPLVLQSLGMMATVEELLLQGFGALGGLGFRGLGSEEELDEFNKRLRD